MKNHALSFFQYRKQLRRELFLQRLRDHDDSEIRLFNDGKKLDAQLLAHGYQLAYPTEWGKYRAKTTLQVGTADLIDLGE